MLRRQFPDLRAHQATQFAKRDRERVSAIGAAMPIPLSSARTNLIDEVSEESLKALQAPSHSRAGFWTVHQLPKLRPADVGGLYAVLLDLQREVSPQHSTVAEHVEQATGYLAVVVLSLPLAHPLGQLRSL